MNEQEFLYKKNKYLAEFILVYKSLPCLWRLKSKEYHMKHLRTKAYAKLIEKLREIDPTADRISVVKKINSLRSCWRKEKRKASDLAKQGVEYQPRLWYFNLFSFLDGQERSRPSDDQSEEENEEVNVKVEEADNEHDDEYDKEDDDPLLSLATGQDEFSREVMSPPPKKQKKAPETEFPQASSSKMGPEHRISKVHYDENSSHESREDQFDVFGKNVAAKLRDIAFSDNTQRLIAEKIVNDALFLAEMGQLTLAHSKLLHTE